MPIKTALTTVLATLATALAAASSLADGVTPDDQEQYAFLKNRHVFSAGIAMQSTDAQVSAGVEGFDPVSISLDDLGVEDRDNSYYLEYRYRFRPKWSVSAGAYSFSGSGGQTSERDFNYDGVEFTTGTELRAEFDVDAYLIDLMYSVYQSETFEIQLGGGIHALDLGVSVAGRVSINDASGELRESATSLLAPVPNLRGSMSWAVTERFGVNLIGGWLSANVADYDGRFLYGHLRGVYQLTDRFGISLGYQVTDIDITQTRRAGELGYDVTLDGPTVTVQYSF